MTKLFATRLALVAMMTMLVSPAISAQQGDETPPPSKPGKPINTGDVLSGELNAMKVRDVKNGKRVATYQITSEPRRLPPPERAVQSRDRPGDLPARHLHRCAGCTAEIVRRQRDLGQGRRDRLRQRRRPDERGRDHEVELDQEAVEDGSSLRRHCEEPLRRSNPDCRCGDSLDCFASLAMTNERGEFYTRTCSNVSKWSRFCK
ncbi:hypothetical protein ABIA42_007393 [Bradyrhizobium sp. USDA 327]